MRAWQEGGEDPYRLYNGPHASPPHRYRWRRIKLFIYACAEIAYTERREVAEGMMQASAHRAGSPG